MSVKSRVPDSLEDETSMRAFLDALDRRQLKLGELTNLSGTATLADVITAINAMLQTHRIR
jgi:hypothetical protein